MKAKREYRSRDAVDVAILDALVDGREDGMTVFEVRAHVDVEIDELETALARLKDDRLITVDGSGSRTLIKPAERVIPEPGENDDRPSFFEEIRRRFPF